MNEMLNDESCIIIIIPITFYIGVHLGTFNSVSFWQPKKFLVILSIERRILL